MKKLLDEVLAALMEIRNDPGKLALLNQGYKQWAEGFEEDEGVKPTTLGHKLEGLCNAVELDPKEDERGEHKSP